MLLSRPYVVSVGLDDHEQFQRVANFLVHQDTPFDTYTTQCFMHVIIESKQELEQFSDAVGLLFEVQ